MLKKLSLVSMGNIFNSLLGLAFLTAVARTLSIDDFGRYALISSLLVSISKGIDFGSNSIYVARAIKTDEQLKDIFISLKIILFIVTIPLSLIVLMWLNLLTSSLFLIFLVGLFAYGINLTLFTFYQKIERFDLAIGLNTIPSVIKAIFAVLIFLKLYEPDLNGAFAVFSVSMLFGNLLFAYLPAQYKKFNFTLRGVYPMLIESVPAGIALMINNGWTAIANTIAKIARTFTDVGIYSIANKVGNLFTLISLSLFTVLLPKNAYRKKENLAYNLSETLKLSLGILLLAVVSSYAAKYGLVLVFGEKYAASVDLLGILVFASAFTAIHTFVDNYYFVEEKTGIMLYITLVKLVGFLGLAILLTPPMALKGLALAQLYSSVIATILSFMFIYRQSRA